MITNAASALGPRLRRGWRRLADAAAPPPVILMYHRVARDRIDPWGLCVSPDNFAAQIEYLGRRRRPMRLQELVERLRRNECPRRAVVVTFDDGYRDNLEAALPVLEARRVPATVFCTSGAIGSGRAFWWDRLACAMLGPQRLPPALSLDVGGQRRVANLDAAVRYDAPQRDADRAAHADTDADTASPRLRLYREVWGWLRPLAEAERSAALDEIVLWCAASGGCEGDAPLPLSREQARRLAASPWIEIGAHSVTHAALSTLAREAQRLEIGHSRQQLEQIVGQRVTSFAYPFGDEEPDTAALVREAGFSAACTAEPAAVRAGADPFRLPRIAVGDWDARMLARAIEDLP